ncbi:MAG: hypothetical protein WCH34_18595 [Bacteroidota bacterium]
MTQDWKSIEPAKIILIGHDPRLQESHTIASFVMFADYYFRPEPKINSEKQKFGLAKSAFVQVTYLTSGKFKPEQIYLTNLCNNALPHAPKGKMVFIPKAEAEKGIKNIKKILKDNPTIEYIFPMSLQVNYWLQKLNFYDSMTTFVSDTEPKIKGVENDPPYFEPKKSSTFLMVCGHLYTVNDGKQTLIPILHNKNFPIKRNFIAYQVNYNEILAYFQNI